MADNEGVAVGGGVERFDVELEAAYEKVSREVWAACLELAEDLAISEDDLMTMMTSGLHDRLVGLQEGRQVIAVNPSDVRFYDSVIQAELGEAGQHRQYADTYDRLLRAFRGA